MPDIFNDENVLESHKESNKSLVSEISKTSRNSSNDSRDRDSSSMSDLLSDLKNKHIKAILEREPMFLNLLVSNQQNTLDIKQLEKSLDVNDGEYPLHAEQLLL